VDQPVRSAVLRDGRQREVEVVLKARVRELDGAALDARLDGARLAELPERLRQRGGRGVRVEAVLQGSRAARNGLRPGDLIVATNRRDLADLAELQRRLESPPAQLLLTVVRGRGAILLLVE
jgi:serine protease Do